MNRIMALCYEQNNCVVLWTREWHCAMNRGMSLCYEKGNGVVLWTGNSVQCTLYLYTVQCTVYTVHSVFWVEYTLYNILYIQNYIHYIIVYTGIVYSIHYTSINCMYSVYWYSVQRVYNIPCQGNIIAYLI